MHMCKIPYVVSHTVIYQNVSIALAISIRVALHEQ